MPVPLVPAAQPWRFNVSRANGKGARGANGRLGPRDLYPRNEGKALCASVQAGSADAWRQLLNGRRLPGRTVSSFDGAATAHVATHAPHAAAYAAKASASAEAERAWQYDHLPEHLRPVALTGG
jgi:hypothetical protein